MPQSRIWDPCFTKITPRKELIRLCHAGCPQFSRLVLQLQTPKGNNMNSTGTKCPLWRKKKLLHQLRTHSFYIIRADFLVEMSLFKTIKTVDFIVFFPVTSLYNCTRISECVSDNLIPNFVHNSACLNADVRPYTRIITANDRSYLHVHHKRQNWQDTKFQSRTIQAKELQKAHVKEETKDSMQSTTATANNEIDKRTTQTFKNWGTRKLTAAGAKLASKKKS